VSKLQQTAIRTLLRLIQLWDRLRLARLMRRHPGLEIDPRASTNLAVARFVLEPGARLKIGPGVRTERIPGQLRFEVQAGGSIEIAEDVWLCNQVAANFLRAYSGAQLRVGRASCLNGCLLSAKQEVEIGEKVLIGMGTRIFDSDQHAVDSDHPEVTLPVRIDDYAWLAADVTILRGVVVGAHSVVATRSLVRTSIPPHRVAFGVPAQLYGSVGDRSKVLP
jgi:carbonic anhydrase/acetyltransferase-like protein (isoleucine patch superfamily)